jgi:osmotically-inducible protein OsmY
VLGDVVVLLGQAASRAKREAAGRVAWRAPGVVRVENRIDLA